MERVQAAEGGSPDALDRLLARAHGFAVRTAARYTDHRGGVDDDLAADVAQDALIYLARNARRCRARSERAFFGWMSKVVRHAALQLLRRRGTRPLAGRRRADFDDLSTGETRARTEALTADDAGPGGAHEPGGPLGTLLHLACEAYDTLSPETATLVWARLVAGDAWSELADRFGIHESAARRRFDRARDGLARRVGRGLAALPEAERRRVYAWLDARDIAVPGDVRRGRVPAREGEVRRGPSAADDVRPSLDEGGGRRRPRTSPARRGR